MFRAVLAICLWCTVARANSDDIVSRPIVLPVGGVAAELTIESNFAHHFWAQPLSFAPDAWWGATDALTVGIVHSNASVDRFAPGASLCVTTDDVLYCDTIYHGSGIDARYRLIDGPLALAPRARLLVRDIDPFKPALTLGVLAKWTHTRFAITADPYLQFGLANQERGNRAQLFVPIELALQPTCRWQVALSTGWNSIIDLVDEDGWHVPVALGVRARATAHIDIGATFGFPTLLGPQNTPKQRVAFLAIGWRR